MRASWSRGALAADFEAALAAVCAGLSHATLDAPSGAVVMVPMVPSVLIVDDEKHTREGLQQALADSYDVSIAANADEAFNLMEAQTFDVILTDLRMPGKSGLKVIDKAYVAPGIGGITVD
jgi:PleD family two-component response regulator